jgi:hypothetical protein
LGRKDRRRTVDDGTDDVGIDVGGTDDVGMDVDGTDDVGMNVGLDDVGMDVGLDVGALVGVNVGALVGLNVDTPTAFTSRILIESTAIYSDVKDIAKIDANIEAF